jgi:tetratricopeptide (TPR) repeat protein
MDGSPRASVFAYKEELDCWLDGLLHEKEISSRKSFFLSKKKWVMVLTLSILFVSILIIVAWKILSPKTEVLSTSGKPSLAILYIRNNTGEESLDYLRSGLCDLLTGDLSQSSYLNVLSEDRLFYILQNLRLLDVENYDTKDLARFAEYAHVDNVVIGDIVKAGKKLRINTNLIKISSGENIALESSDCISQAEIFSLVDEISKRIKAQLEVPPDRIVDESDKRMERIATSSIEAFKYYNEGKQLFYRGQALKSASYLVKAIEIDPKFAQAYKMLAMCYRALPGYEDNSKNCMKKAFEFRHHVSDRERLLIQAHYYFFLGETAYNEAIKTYKELLRIYPDDSTAFYNLGALYRYIEDWDKSIEVLNDIAPTDYFGGSRLHLRYAFRARGNYADALKLAKSVPEDLFPSHYTCQLALDLFFRGKLDPALHEAKKLLDRNEDWYPALRLIGDIYLLKDDWIHAEECYKNWLDSRVKDRYRLRYRNLALARLAWLNIYRGNFDKAISYLKQRIKEVLSLGEQRWLHWSQTNIAYIYYKKGDLDKAAEECRNALDSTLENRSVRGRIPALHLQGLVALEMSNLNEAQIIADKIKKEVDNWLNPKLMRYYYHLMGHIFLEKNNIGDAIAYFEKAAEFLSWQYDPEGKYIHALLYESLALAFYKAKDYESARRWYEKIVDLTSCRIYDGDIYVKSFFMMGKIYEQKGQKKKAIEHFEKFLTLWKDADPGLPEVEDAKLRLIALTD